MYFRTSGATWTRSSHDCCIIF